MGEFEEKLNSILSSPEDMEKIMNLARSLSSSAGNQDGRKDQDREEKEKAAENVPAALKAGEIDPKMLKLISRITREYSSAGDDSKAALLGSIKPYLKAGRQDTIDRALKVLKISKLAKIAMDEFGGDFHL